MSERRKGFYLAGSFWKGEKPKYMFLHQNQKPFEIDVVEGDIQGKAIPIFHKKHRYWFPSCWRFIEGHKISDINTDTTLRKDLNEIWKKWCKDNKRKQFDIVDE
jgi:hypothetical protein